MGKKTQLQGIQSHPCACFCYAAFTAHAKVLLWEGKEESRHFVCVKSKAQVPDSVLVKGNNVFKRKLSHKAFKVVCEPAFVARHCYERKRRRAAILFFVVVWPTCLTPCWCRTGSSPPCLWTAAGSGSARSVQNSGPSSWI